MEKIFTLTKKDFTNAITTLEKGNGDGVVYQKVMTIDNVDLHIVFGYCDGYDKGEKHQKQIGDTIYTLCAKIAYNVDDLQCDFDIDWYMPIDKVYGDVYDTCSSVDDSDYIVDFYNQEIKTIAEMLKNGDLTVDFAKPTDTLH